MKTFTKFLPFAVLAGTTAVLFVGCASADHDHSSHADGTVAKPYPRHVCLVTDQAFKHGEPYTFVHDGQEIKLCCKKCLADFKLNPSQYLARLGDGK